MMFNPSNWYWAVGGSTTQVYSSARNAYVSTSDTDYVAWLEAGNAPTKIDEEINIWPYVNATVPSWMFIDSTFARPSLDTWSKPQLKAYAAAVRYDKEVGGTTVSNAVYPTDRESQSKMTAAVVLSQVNPSAVFSWKVADGSFVSLDAPAILTVASTVGAFVGGCFATEGEVVASIDDGTITTLTQIEAAFA